MQALLLYILRSWFEESATPAGATGWATALADPAISAALQAIHRDLARPWTVQSLADHAHLSRATFSRRFTALTGRR
ncbi:AraC family transcriptional regulator [Micromonospora sp. KC606]|uniref:AraC family transcriptional regulator n=1 Tax=Micromonospora sp. KC606 TaxID=2530379 RepID=UPI001FB5FB6F|nr:AraC family transcriptional regulator [Micromonospora sp. KC606]